MAIDKVTLMDVIDTVIEKLKHSVTDVESTDLSEEEKRSRIIHLFSVISAAVAVQPIPLLIYLSWLLSKATATRLSDKGMPITDKMLEIVKQVGVVVGLGMVAQQIALGLLR